MSQRENIFRYFLYKLNAEYRLSAKEVEREVSGLSYVKIMKFLFFSSVLEKDPLLGEDNFKNWYALPKGPVEDFCYGILKDGKTKALSPIF